MKTFQETQDDSTEKLPAWYTEEVHAKVCQILETSDRLQTVKYLVDLSKEYNTRNVFGLKEGLNLTKNILPQTGYVPKPGEYRTFDNPAETPEVENETKKLVKQMTDYVNTFNNKAPEFISVMSYEHRTLQQSFTKLCLQWIEHVASEGYRTDARNQQSHIVAQKLLDAFREKMIDEGYTSTSPNIKPSSHCTMI